MHAANAGAQQIARFGWWVLIAFCVAAAIVWLLLAHIATRGESGSFAEHAPAEEEKGRPWIVIGGLGIPTVVFFAFFALMLAPMHAESMHEPAGKPADIRIVGRQWW